MDTFDPASINWVAVGVAVIAAVGTVAAQVLSRAGEPRRLRMLKLMNEVIHTYGRSDAGKRSLIMARHDLAQKTARFLLLKPLYIRILQVVESTLIVVSLAGLVIAFVSVLVSAPNWVAMAALETQLISFGVFLPVLAIRWLSERHWRKQQALDNPSSLAAD